MSWVEVTTAVGTAGAAVVALALGIRAEWRAIRTEHEMKMESERKQAIHVAAWMLVEQDDGKGPCEIDQRSPSFKRRKARVYEVVQNASEEPIWDVVVYAPIFTNNGKGSDVKVIQAKNAIMCIGPHESHKSEITALTIKINRFPLGIEFRDNAGRDWSRDGRGRLYYGRTSPASFLSPNETVAEKSFKWRRKSR